MAEIKLIDKDTDLSKVLHPVPWDAFINGFQYQVYCVYEETKDDTIYYNHSIGGHWGENHYWAIPRGESLHWSHFIEFNGDACCWGFNVRSINTVKSKWGECCAEHKYVIDIIRNDEVFNTILAYDLLYGISKANVLITEYQEHPLELNNFEYDKKMIGREVQYHGIPCKITHYCKGLACVFLTPTNEEDIERFYKPQHNTDDEYIEDYYEECKIHGGLKVDIDSRDIWWFK